MGITTLPALKFSRFLNSQHKIISRNRRNRRPVETIFNSSQGNPKPPRSRWLTVTDLYLSAALVQTMLSPSPKSATPAGASLSSIVGTA